MPRPLRPAARRGCRRHPGSPTPEDVVEKTISVEEGSDYYEGAEGRLHFRFWKAEEPSWVVLLAHGFGDHSGRWARYGRTLAEAGSAVLACDHRGHGLSEGP